MSSPAVNRWGILAMLAAMALFVGNDALVKLAATSHPPGLIMAVRGLLASLIALSLVAAMGEIRRVTGLLSPLVFLRALVEAGVAFLYITSLAHLPLANITAILQATPILMTLISVVIGLERVGWRRWSAVIAGFLGVLLVVKPNPAGFDVFALIALGSAGLVAIRDLVTRAIGPAVPSIVVTLSTTVAVGLAGAALGLGEAWKPLAFREGAFLVGAALLVTGGNLCIIMAFRHADVSAVSPFRYSIVVMAIVLGFLIFGELPDLIACGGIVLIVASGLFTVHREQARLRLGTRVPEPAGGAVP